MISTQMILSVTIVVVFIFTQTLLIYITKKSAKKYERVEHRTGLIIKHIRYATVFLITLGLFLIWGVAFEDLSSVLLSVFAVIGIGFFAQWSILSNITSGVIMFFIFPYKIGDYIKIHDKEHDFQGTIEDIKTFHLILKTNKGEHITYPNSLVLQKGVSVFKPDEIELVDKIFPPKEQDEDKSVKEQPTD